MIAIYTYFGIGFALACFLTAMIYRNPIANANLNVNRFLFLVYIITVWPFYLVWLVRKHD